MLMIYDEAKKKNTHTHNKKNTTTKQKTNKQKMIITALKMNNKRLNKKEKLRHFNKLKKKSVKS